jgi:hypothetical protein
MKGLSCGALWRCSRRWSTINEWFGHQCAATVWANAEIDPSEILEEGAPVERGDFKW